MHSWLNTPSHSESFRLCLWNLQGRYWVCVQGSKSPGGGRPSSQLGFLGHPQWIFLQADETRQEDCVSFYPHTHSSKPQADFCRGLQFPNITGVQDNWRNWCFRRMSGVDRRPPVGMHTCFRVLSFPPSVREFCSRLRFSHFSPATCTSSASWRSRWLCSGRTAGSRSSRTGILYRLAVMTIPCQWWVATPAEDPPFVPRRQKLPLLQLEPRPPRGSCQKVLRKHAANTPSFHPSHVPLVSS